MWIRNGYVGVGGMSDVGSRPKKAPVKLVMFSERWSLRCELCLPYKHSLSCILKI